MIIVLSDLHITDASTSFNVDATAFTKILGPWIKENIKNKVANELHIVLLGDIFDVVRTDYWERNKIPYDDRPWNGSLDPLTAMNSNTTAIKNQFADILSSILDTPSAKGLLKMLGSFSDGVGGKKTKVTYVIGNKKIDSRH